MRTRFEPCLLVSLVLATTTSAYGRLPLVVDADDPACGSAGGPFCTVRVALDAAQAGARVRIRSTGDSETIVVRLPGVVLHGADNPVIDVGCMTAIRIEADDVTVRNLTIVGASSGIVAEGPEGAPLYGLRIEGNTLGGVAVSSGELVRSKLLRAERFRRFEP